MKFSLPSAALALGLLTAGSAYATDAAAPTAIAKPDKAAMEARSQECLKEADVQGLSGHKRRVFRDKCRRGVK